MWRIARGADDKSAADGIDAIERRLDTINEHIAQLRQLTARLANIERWVDDITEQLDTLLARFRGDFIDALDCGQ